MVRFTKIPIINASFSRNIKKLSVPRSEIVSKLKNNYEFAKKWEGKYEDWANGWGGHYRNEYAMLCHRAAKKSFFNAYLEAKKLAASCENSRLTWVLIFSNQGGSSGSKTVTTVVGEKAEKTVSSQLSRSITASVSGPIAALTAGLEASVASEIANSFTASSHRSHTDTLKINLDKPAYVYQMVANVETGTGVVYAIGGNMQIFNKPIVLN